MSSTPENSAKSTATLPGISADVPLANEEVVRGRVADLVDSGITLRRIAVETGVSVPDVKRWLEGASAQAASAALAGWLEEVDAETRANAEDFVETPTARRIMRAFDQAREAKDT